MSMMYRVRGNIHCHADEQKARDTNTHDVWVKSNSINGQAFLMSLVPEEREVVEELSQLLEVLCSQAQRVALRSSLGLETDAKYVALALFGARVI